MPSMYLHNLNT